MFACLTATLLMCAPPRTRISFHDTHPSSLAQLKRDLCLGKVWPGDTIDTSRRSSPGWFRTVIPFHYTRAALIGLVDWSSVQVKSSRTGLEWRGRMADGTTTTAELAGKHSHQRSQRVTSYRWKVGTPSFVARGRASDKAAPGIDLQVSVSLTSYVSVSQA